MSRRLNALLIPVLAGTLFACASKVPMSNRDVVNAAKVELTAVRTGLDAYLAEHDSYPATSMISSHNELIQVLSPYISLPRAASPERRTCRIS